MTKLIIFNGPPGSGKDYATRLLLKTLENEDVIHYKLSQPLKDIVSNFAGISQVALEAIKNNPSVSVHGVATSYRDLQIAAFEALARVFGDDWLGRTMVNRINNNNVTNIVISDGGRNVELVPLIRAFGARNILVIQLARKNASFAGDIREYLSDPRVRTELIFNNGDNSFDLEVVDLVLSFLVE